MKDRKWLLSEKTSSRNARFLSIEILLLLPQFCILSANIKNNSPRRSKAVILSKSLNASKDMLTAATPNASGKMAATTVNPDRETLLQVIINRCDSLAHRQKDWEWQTVSLRRFTDNKKQYFFYGKKNALCAIVPNLGGVYQQEP